MVRVQGRAGESMAEQGKEEVVPVEEEHERLHDVHLEHESLLHERLGQEVLDDDFRSGARPRRASRRTTSTRRAR